ncbi:MAG: hypothetical protein MUF49_15045 [Oculatellaceae cyanobacterium Prado106]|nr:hypothetical protein [Oculatellaceae cyanobacterium Prado106]
MQDNDPVLAAQTLFQPQQPPTPTQPTVWQKGDCLLVLTAGGAGLGGAIGQFPGAILGGILAAIFAWFTPPEPGEQVTER